MSKKTVDRESGDSDVESLDVVTHDSFDISEELIARFEEEHNAKIKLIQPGDANEIVNRAILNAGNPEGDVLFGVDNLSFQRAVSAGVFSEYRAERRDEIPADILAQFDDSPLLTPVDVGWVDLNFDRAAGTPPASLEELTEPQWRGKLVVQDPATSSTGLQFLAMTVAYFGEGGWQDYWRDLRANDVLVTFGWTEAYTVHFSNSGGDRPLVVSYTTSPAAEVFFGDLSEPPTLTLALAPLSRQVEAAGILAGADHEELAREFIDFMLSDEYQQQIPSTVFVFLVIGGLDAPDWWQWAVSDVETVDLVPSEEDVNRWIREWTEIMRR